MYVSPNFPTKAALKKAVSEGKTVTVFNPGVGGPSPVNGVESVEGPHSPKPHTWYARVTIVGGKVTKVS